MNCSKCRGAIDGVGHFKIEHVDRSGVTSASATVCSIACLLGWGYDYATMAGLRMAASVKQKVDGARAAITSLMNAMKGT